MLLTSGNGFPGSFDIQSASPAECRLIEPLLDKQVAGEPVGRLIYGKAADSDGLRDRLAARRVELICPHRKNRKRPKRQDGRPLRRYKRRWVVERTIAWLFNFRRVVVRYERHGHLFGCFVKLTCQFTTLQKL